MLSQSNLLKSRYWPEILPDVNTYALIPSGVAASPAPIDIRSMPGYEVKLLDLTIPTPAVPTVNLDIKTDRATTRIGLSGAAPGLYQIGLAAREMFTLNVVNIDVAPLVGYSLGATWMITKPTIAEKLLRKWQLTPEEKAIAQELDVYATVEKGILPLAWDYTKSREYQVLEERTFATSALYVAGTAYTVLDLKVNNSDEFWVLEQVAVSGTDPAAVITMDIRRDDDASYHSLNIQANLRTANVWIPALKELIITTSTLAVGDTVTTTFVAKRMRLTNVLKARWELPSAATLPGDVVKKVKAGIL